EVIEPGPGRVLDRLPQAAWSAGRERRVDLLHLAWRCGLPLRARSRRAGQDWHDRVARNAQHDGAPQAWRQVQDEHGIRALASHLRAEPLVAAAARVRADDQDVQRTVVALRASPQASDLDVTDLAEDIAVDGVTGQDSADQDDGKRDGCPGEHA